MREREREDGGEGEVLLTIKKWLKVGKHNALSGNTASGRTDPAQHMTAMTERGVKMVSECESE